MFITQITAIESEIQSLTEKLNQYRALENQVESVKHALAQIQQTTQALDPQIIPEMFASLGLPATNFQTSEQQAEQVQREAEHQETAQKQAQQEEEITTLKQQLLAAQRKAKAVQENYQELERKIMNEKEMLEEQKIAYVEHMKDLEDTAAQFVFPSDIEQFIRTGKFEFDLASDLEQVVEYLDKTPDWCLKARVKHLWSIACLLVREQLGEYLPPNLLWIWKECVIAAQAVNQLPTQMESPCSAQLEPNSQELVQEQSNQHEKADEKPIVGTDKFLMMYGERPSGQLVNLVQDEEESPYGYEQEGGKTYTLGVEEDDCWGEEWIEDEDWNAPSAKEDNKQPELESGDTVQIKTGEVCTIENIDFIGVVAYFSLRMPSGKVQSGFRACDFHRVSTGTQEKLPQNSVESLQAPQAEEITAESTEAVNPVIEVPLPNSQAVPRVGSTVKVPGGRIGEVTCFSLSIMGQELVTVEFTTPKRKKKSTEQFLVNKVTVLQGEAEDTIALPENESIGLV